jgi:hypothetical protein
MDLVLRMTTPGARYLHAWRRVAVRAQYFGAGVAGAPPAGAGVAAPLLAGAAAPPPLALQELFPPAGGGDAAPGSLAAPPPQPTIEPISIPATADIARAFAMFIVSSPRSSSEELLGFPAIATPVFGESTRLD